MQSEATKKQNRSAGTKAVAACALGLLGILQLSASAASADSHFHNTDAVDCYVDGFRYENNGAYTIEKINLIFVTSKFAKSLISADDYPDILGFNIYSGGSTNIDLNKLDNVSGDVANSKLKDGMEVWPWVKIFGGESNSCHKDGHRLIYKKGINRVIRFKSGGTTQNNNRCEYEGSIKDQCSSFPKQEPR